MIFAAIPAIYPDKIRIVNGKLIDKITTYDEYLESDEMARKRQGFVALTEEQLEENDADTAE